MSCLILLMLFELSNQLIKSLTSQATGRLLRLTEKELDAVLIAIKARSLKGITTYN